MKDSGDGIDLDILPKLFSKFARTSYNGTGLRLYICKGIIEAHGGKTWGENNVEGKGGYIYVKPAIRIVPSSSFFLNKKINNKKIESVIDLIHWMRRCLQS